MSSKQEEDAKNNDDTIDNRLSEFVETFVHQFEKKIDNYRKKQEIGAEKKLGKIGETIAAPIGGAAGAAVGLATGLPGAPAGGSNLGSKISRELWRFGSDKKRRQRAKRITELFRRVEKDELRAKLVEASGNIFWSFQSQFTMVTDADGYWIRAMTKLAADAIDRAVDYIKCCEENTAEVSSELIAQSVILGNSKGGMVATIMSKKLQNALRLPKPGHTLLTKDSEIWKTSELYEKVGLVTIKGDGTVDKYYKRRKKDGSNANKYGYRLLLSWELKDSFELIDEEKKHPGNEYTYTLKSEEIKKKVGFILSKINKDDPTLKLDRIEEKLDELCNKFEAGKESEQVKELIWFNVREPTDLFTGRRKELNNLHNRIQRNSEKVTVVSQMTSLSGLGGIGKTELAKKYIEEHREDYDNNIVWINAEGEIALAESFRRLAIDKLKISTRDEERKEKDIKFIVEEVYKFCSKKKCLFIFDNAENSEYLKRFLPLYSSAPDAIKPYILITSRDQEWARGIEVINLTELELEDAIELVKKGLDIPKEDTSQDQEIKNLVELLQKFPLAIQQAIAYIAYQRREEDFGIKEFVKKYEKKANELLESEVFRNFFIDNEYERTTFTAWQITIEKIASNEQYGQLALRILDVIAYLAPDNIRRELFLKLAEGDETKLKSAVRLLVRYSMINGDKKHKQSLLSIHRLVQKVTRLNLEKESKEQETLRVTLISINSGNISKEITDHGSSVWNYASKYGKLIDDFYSNSIYGYSRATPLHLLTENGKFNASKAILEHIKEKNSNKFNKIINSKDIYDRTPLYIAAENGQIGVSQLLVDNGVEINTKSSLAYQSSSTKWSSGWTPLHIAALNGYIDIVIILVNKNKAVINTENSIGITPAVLAATRGQINVVKYLKPGNNVYLLQAKLTIALKSGNAHEFKTFIETIDKNQLGGLLNSKLGEWAALHLAAFSGKIDIVAILIEYGAEIKSQVNSFTPLHCASNSNRLDVVKLLISKGADPKDANKDGWTSLHSAAQKGHLTIVKYFINDLNDDKKIDINITDKKGDTPLHTAAFHGNLEVVKFLLEKGANINAVSLIGTTPIFSAALCYNFNIVRYLLNEGAEVKTVDSKTLIGRLNVSLLHLAAAYDDDKLIQYLIEDKGINVDIGKDSCLTPLHLAAFCNSTNVIKYLTEKGADTSACIKFSNIINVLNDIEGSFTLRASSAHGLVKRLIGVSRHFSRLLKLTPGIIFEVLNYSDEQIKNKLHVNEQSKFSVGIARWILNLGPVQKQVDSLRVFIDGRQGPDFSRPVYGTFFKENDDGNTTLHLAVEGSDVELVKFLISEKVDLNIKNNNGQTPLYLAVQKGHIEIIELLIQNGADVLTRSDHDTLLHQAVNGNNEKILRIILDKIIEKNSEGIYEYIEAKDREGNTPLMCAIKDGKTNAAEVLSEYGTDLTVSLINNVETTLHPTTKEG